MLLDPETLARLAGFRLVRRQPLRGAADGLRRSRQQGGGVEFADFREYTPGDDPRRVDWKAYARLRRLYVREYAEDRRDCVLFLLDNSASMGYGEPLAKGDYAAQVLAGLLACALAGQDQPLVAATGGDGAFFKPGGGSDGLAGSFKYLQGIRFAGRADLTRSLAAALQAAPQAQSLYLFSDLYDLDGLNDLLRLAAARGLAVTCLQTLAPEEWQPGGEGDWELVDSESGARLEVTITPLALAAYARRLREFTDYLDGLCRRYGARRVPLNSGEGATATLFKTLPQAGVTRMRG